MYAPNIIFPVGLQRKQCSRIDVDLVVLVVVAVPPIAAGWGTAGRPVWYYSPLRHQSLARGFLVVLGGLSLGCVRRFGLAFLRS